jgi:hypothetical protein
MDLRAFFFMMKSSGPSEEVIEAGKPEAKGKTGAGRIRYLDAPQKKGIPQEFAVMHVTRGTTVRVSRATGHFNDPFIKRTAGISDRFYFTAEFFFQDFFRSNQGSPGLFLGNI